MSVRKTKSAGKAQIPNHQIVVAAAFLAGAQRSSVDTEDIAVKANQLAPGRFTWRKYKDQINIDTVRKRLWDATKPDKGGYLIGSEKTGWRLTKAGFDLARSLVRSRSLKKAPVPRASQLERVAQSRELRRMLSEPAFQKIRDGRAATLTKADVEHFFRIDDYVSGSTRTAKIERFRILSSGNPELLQVVEILAEFVTESPR